MDKDIRKSNFIARAKEKHKGENLDYSQVEYFNNRTPVKIIDHDLRPDGTEYGEFWQTPSNHLKGQMHPDKRGARISKGKTITQEEIIMRFKEAHKGENLDYSEVEYKGMHSKVKIISHDLRPDGAEYGEFWQEPAVHLKGCTHPEISRTRQVALQTSTTEEFIRKAKKVHEDACYDYSLVEYVGNRTKVKIICGRIGAKGVPHGVFSITPDNFLQGKGCPKCGNRISKAEDEIIQFISGIVSSEVVKGEHGILEGMELDIYVPSKKAAFEYNGLRWHSEQFGKGKDYHLRKKELCEAKGVKLFHIFEDEFKCHKDCLLSKIRRIMGNTDGVERIGARKCVVREISGNDASGFLNVNHIEGFAKASVHIGAFYGGELVSVASFSKRKGDEWNMVRSATANNYLVQGITSKILKYFISKFNPKRIKAFLDRRWEIDRHDNVYVKCGFRMEEVLKPGYTYTDGHCQRLPKSCFNKEALLKKYPDKGLDESMAGDEMARKLGFYRIWDCGLIKYVYDNPSYIAATD